MIIRCERCSTTYELDEALLAPDGSPVQCTRCEHVFTAVPPGKPDRAAASPAPPPAAHAPQPPVRSPTAPEPPPVAARPVRATQAPARADASAPRAVRTSSPAVYRPPAASSPPPVTSRAGVLKRDTVGAFEARLRWSARWRWLAPALAVAVVLVLALVGWLLFRRGGEARATRVVSEALALAARDDAASLDEAVDRLGEVVQRAPKLKAAAADRALALALRAATLSEEREALVARLSARNDERERLRRETPSGWEDADRVAAADAAALEPDVRARDERARALVQAAADQLRALQGQVGDTPEVVRAFATLHVVRGEREQAQRLLRALRERGRTDPWLDLADGWLDVRDTDRATRDRALVKLGALAAAHPDLLRGRYLLARAEASLGRRTEALTTVDGVLAANSRHEGARRLRTELAAVPAAAPPALVTQPAAPSASPPAVNAPPRSRKAVPQPGPAPSHATPPPAEPTPAPAVPSWPLPSEPPPPAAVAAPALAPAPAVEPPPPPAEKPPEPPPRHAEPPVRRLGPALDPDSQGG